MVDNSELTTISDLTPLAIYTIRVQAFTSMGAGECRTFSCHTLRIQFIHFKEFYTFVDTFVCLSLLQDQCLGPYK